MATTILTPARMADWLAVLDRIDASITRALSETAEYERTLTAAPPPGASAEAKPPTDGYVRGLRMHLDAATRLADGLEALLAADEGEARAWTGLAAHVKARLETAPPAGIS